MLGDVGGHLVDRHDADTDLVGDELRVDIGTLTEHVLGDLARDDMGLRIATIRTLRETGRHQEAVDAAVDALQVNARSLPV